MRSTTRLAVTTVTATLIVVSGASAALAQSTTIKDRRADVVQYDGLNDDSGTGLDPAQSGASGIDATKAKIKHAKKSVTIKVSFANLTSDFSALSAEIRTTGKSHKTYTLYNTSATHARLENSKGKKVCSVDFTTKTGAHGSLYASVSRECLGNPKKVKVSVAATRFVPIEGNPNDLTVQQDVISPTKLINPTATKWLKSS